MFLELSGQNFESDAHVDAAGGNLSIEAVEPDPGMRGLDAVIDDRGISGSCFDRGGDSDGQRLATGSWQ